MRYLPVVVLSIAGWLFLSAAFATLLAPVAGGLKRSRSEERKVSLSVEDRTPDGLMDVANVVREPLPDDFCCDMHNRHCALPSELCCWRCTEAMHTFAGPHADGSECVLSDAPSCYRDGLFPDGRTYHDIWPAPAETYGQERLYNAGDLVQVGLAMVHRRCADARRDAATDHICDPCGRIFGKAMTS